VRATTGGCPYGNIPHLKHDQRGKLLSFFHQCSEFHSAGTFPFFSRLFVDIAGFQKYPSLVDISLFHRSGSFLDSGIFPSVAIDGDLSGSSSYVADMLNMTDVSLQFSVHPTH
jgi:hypothetical protein